MSFLRLLAAGRVARQCVSPFSSSFSLFSPRFSVAFSITCVVLVGEGGKEPNFMDSLLHVFLVRFYCLPVCVQHTLSPPAAPSVNLSSLVLQAMSILFSHFNGTGPARRQASSGC